MDITALNETPATHHAAQLLAARGYPGARVYRVDAEGPASEIAFVHDSTPRTARVTVEHGQTRVDVTAGWSI